MQRQAAVAREVDPRRVAEAGREWYTLSEVAQVLGLSRQAVHARVKKGQLDAEKVDGVWRVSDATVVAAVEAKRREALSLGSVRLLPVGAPADDVVAQELVNRLEALETVVGDLQEEGRRAQAERDQELAVLEDRCARLQAALHQMVELLGSAPPGGQP